MILAHLSLSETSYYEPSYMPAVLGSFACLAKAAGFLKFNDRQVLMILRISMVYAVITYFSRAVCVIRQFTGFLDINCLSIKSKPARKQL